MEVRSETSSYVGRDVESECLHPISCDQVSGCSHQRQIYDRTHPANVSETSFHSPLSFIVILGFPCLSLAYPSPLTMPLHGLYEPDAEENRSIKVTLSVLSGSLCPHPCLVIRTMNLFFQRSENRAIEPLVQI